ncbi:hypothetical protein CYMTET_56523 [Cymbomonas tetramitiformis]|uniref:WAT1-related protein n=1 Tax=Cymbomonas tetramitiformis TaxID=36881 RepID=A0AAE0BBY6_9CHLO|nr:hypothetical protein CYMTET_56523 [Cymbomonas tetramitiformis]
MSDGASTALKVKRRAYAAVAAVQVTNALYTVLTKHAVKKGGADPLVFSLYRDLAAYPLLQLGALAIDGPIKPKVRDLCRLSLLGLTGMFGNQYSYILGLTLLDATVATVINQAQPVVACVLTAATGLEKFSLKKLLGILLAVGGAICIIGPTNLEHSRDTLLGCLCVCGSCVAMATYYILQKPLLETYPPVSITAWSYLSGFLCMAIPSLQFYDQPSKFKLESDEIVALAFAVLGNSCLKYCLQTYANKNMSVTLLTVCSAFVPLLTGVISYFFLQEQPSIRYLGALPVLVGVLLVVLEREQSKGDAALPASEDCEAITDYQERSEDPKLQPLLQECTDPAEE